MELKIGSIYSGFEFTEEREIKDINCTGRIFVHKKSGARLVHLDTDDDNMVFSITFRTPPIDSTGLPHILEHSVLGGSKKFPAKDPFVELVKGSLNTFLNAMTFSDKTMYPVASRNEKDFFNLMDVYMDGVFNTNIYDGPETFMQEGWHYELDNHDTELNYRGVVYNEMKGAFSSPESILFRKIQESLFPDTPYGFESGGDPDVIPELTYEEFLNYHKKYYHPSNSYIFLYGNGDLLKQLSFIDENYLAKFDKIQVDSKIPLQKPFSSLRELNVKYPVAKEEDTDNKTFLNLNFTAGSSTDPDTYMAFEILEHLLLETPAAPLKEALIDAGLGKDAFGKFDNSIIQPVFSIVVKNSNESEKERFCKVVFDTLRKLVKEGIDKKQIEASINIKEFELREADYRGYPKGLLYNIKCMDSWLYDESPFMHLEFLPQLDHIKKSLTTNYFEQLIEKYLINNNHSSMIVVEPMKGLAEERSEEIRKELDDYKSHLSDKEINDIINQTKSLKERQTTQDTKEVLETIPLLSLGDISPKAVELPLSEKDENGVKVLFHPVFTSGIAYMNLYFDTSLIPKELISYIGLLGEVMGRNSTEKYNYGELSNMININTGGIDFNVETYIQNGDYTGYHPKFVVKSRALIAKLLEDAEIIGEIIGNTRFDDKKRLLEIIRETKSHIEISIFNQGHMVAMRRVISYFSAAGQYDELVGGLSFYKFLVQLEKTYENSADEILGNLKKTAELIFNRDNLILSFTADNDDYGKFKEVFPKILDKLGSLRAAPSNYEFNLIPQNEGLLTQGKVQYSAKGYNFIKLGYSYSGGLQVLRTIAGYDYLWNRIRVQGGAYGAFAGFGRSGNMYFASYRDPNLRETLDVYDGAEDYFKSFDADEREMTKYIIGTISKIDAPLTPSMKGERGAANYISGITAEDLQKERDEILHTKEEDIRKFADMLKDVMKQNNFCVLGNESMIKKSRDIFNNLVDVFE